MPIGPVQLLVVSFDNRTSPEILAELNRLRENQVIRLIDALAVQKNLDGTLAALQWSELPAGEAEGLGATVGALLGLGADGEAGMEAGAIAGMDAGSHGHLIDESEVWDVADAIEPGSAAPLALIEHVWAVPLRGNREGRRSRRQLQRSPSACCARPEQDGRQRRRAARRSPR